MRPHRGAVFPREGRLRIYDETPRLRTPYHFPWSFGIAIVHSPLKISSCGR